MEKRVYGVDIGGTTIKIGRFDAQGTLLRKWNIETDLSDDGKTIIKSIACALIEDGFLESDVLGVGFGVPGPVLDNRVIHAVNLGWRNVDVSKQFKAHLPGKYSVRVANDANIAALGEQRFGAGNKYQNIVFFTLGTGVGGGIVLDGKIVEGAFGAGGEIGHIRVANTNYACNCGNHDCLETVASATGVKRIAKDLLSKDKRESPLSNIDKMSAKAVFRYAEEGDQLALEVVEAVSQYLAHACQILSLITNPEAFVFGGGLSNAGAFLIDRIEKHFKAIAFPPVRDTKFLQATLGNDAGIYGAFQAVMFND